MGVIREAWVDKSSGGKKDASTGTLIPGKENWKKRYVVVEDKPAPTLSWYKTDKVSRPGAPVLIETKLPARALCVAAHGTARPMGWNRHLCKARRHVARLS